MLRFDIAQASSSEYILVLLHSLGLTVDNISHPEPFKCLIQPRSDAAESLVRSIADSELT